MTTRGSNSPMASYYRNDHFRAVSGLGDDASLPLADQSLLAMLQGLPSITYTEWAAQSGDVSWAESIPTNNYQAFAILDQQLVAVASQALSVPQALAVISPTLTFATTVSKAFESTPYAYEKTEAVYSQLDPRDPPQIFYLYWLTLRSATDPKIGNISLNFAATSITGVLSFVLEVPQSSSDRPRPRTSFTGALSAQQASGPLSIPSVSPASPTSLPGPAAIPTVAPANSSPVIASTADKTKAVLLVGLGAAAAVGAYKLYQSYRGG